MFINAPSIVVYPLQANGSLDPEAGSRLSVMLATQIAQLGGVTVKPAPPGIAQRDYLEAARKLGVDYYVSGYITPLGDSASVVEQVVSAYSGSVVWSNTAEMSTYADAAGQGSLIRSAIIGHAGRAFASLGTGEEPAPAAPPESQSASKEANLTLVGPRKPRVASAAGTPAPKQTVAVLPVAGSDSPDRRTYAAGSVVHALKKHGVNAALAPAPAPDPASDAHQVCSQTGATLVLGTTLATQAPQPNAPTTANVVVSAYDCAGQLLGRQTASRDAGGKRGWQVAIDRAVEAAVNDYLRQDRQGT